MLSSDGDIIVYGATIIKNIDMKKGTVEVFNWNSITELMLAEFGADWAAVKDTDLQILHIYSFCALLGCDYLDAPTNFGSKTVVSKFKQHWFRDARSRNSLLTALEAGGMKCVKGETCRLAKGNGCGHKT